MSSAEPDSVAVNREVWTRANAEWGDAARRTWWAGDHWGKFGVARGELTSSATSPASTSSSSAAAPRTSPRGSRGSARASSASTRRRRSSRRRGAAGGDRDRVPARRGARRSGAAAGRVVRPRRLRVRGRDLGRPVAVDPRGGAPASSRRPARVPAQLAARVLLHAADGARSRAAASGRSSAVHASTGRGRRHRVQLSHGDWIRSCASTASSSSADRDLPGDESR